MSLNLAVISREGAKRYGDRAALVAGDTTLSYRQLDDQAQRLAGALRRLVSRGQHVALMMPNVPAFAVAYFACHYAGVAVVPLNVMLKAEEIAYHLEDSDAVALICHESLLGDALTGFEGVAGCRHLIVADEGAPLPAGADLPSGVARMSALLDSGERISQLPDTNPDDTAVLLYTSGTTGRAKGAELTHFNMFYNADVASELHGTDESTIALAVLPLFHSFGQTVILNGTLVRGGTVVLLPRFDATAAFEIMQSHGVTFFAGVPTMYFALLHHPDAAAQELSSLRYCASGGAPMPVEVMRTFDERYSVDIMEGYGLSETSPVASLNQRGRPKKPGSIGTPIWGIEFQLLNDDGEVIEEIGVAGEICIKGHNVMKGYYKRPQATQEAIVDGWFRSGDIATRDEDGYYFIVDRKKDMILRGGYNVYPREVEEVLYTHPHVAEAAVIGVQHESLGEEVKAVVALKLGSKIEPAELIAHCKEHLAAYKYPRHVEILDTLPKGATGKILKRALRGS